jgi:very-short-patch-repair endonuclease
MISTEKILWKHLRSKRFKSFKFRRQEIIKGVMADFYCHSLGLVIKIDEQEIEEDIERDKIMSEKGLTILHFTNQQVIEDIELVLKNIVEKLEDIEDLKDLRQAKKDSQGEPDISLEEVKTILNLK